MGSTGEERPWDVGLLYNQDDRAARIAIDLFAEMGLTVGDNEPYSGKQLNATMDRHAEANGIPMEAGCRAGNCGTCITAIKAGTSRHTIIPSAAAEPGTCLACCSVPTSDLTLEA